jgi:hypothetical protein
MLTIEEAAALVRREFPLGTKMLTRPYDPRARRHPVGSFDIEDVNRLLRRHDAGWIAWLDGNVIRFKPACPA